MIAAMKLLALILATALLNLLAAAQSGTLLPFV
jgi:hypothetical protein